MRLLASSLVLSCLLAPFAAAQATETPPFDVGAVPVYAHASADSLTVWMSTLADDGETPYYLTGAPTVEAQAGQTPAMDPVVDEAFEARIALTPTLAQDIVLSGKATVEAFIGGGGFTAGRAMIATSLAVDGQVLASAAEKEHLMTRKGAEGTYDPISWELDVPETRIPAGAKLEWVIAGTIEAGNNIYLAAHEARGRSAITLPVIAVGPAPKAPGAAAGDGDLLNDTWEQQHFGHLNATGADDPDADGLNNTAEQAAGTDPTKADTDGDGAPDGAEATAGTDPLDPASKPASDAPATADTPSRSAGNETGTLQQVASDAPAEETPAAAWLAVAGAGLAAALRRRRAD